MNVRRIRSKRGFTLIEALAALALATLLFGAIALYTGTWLRSWSHIVTRGAREDTVAVVLDRMIEDLEAAQPLYSSGAMKGDVTFSGEADSIVFVRPALGYGPRAGFDSVNYFNGSVGKDGAIIRSRRGHATNGAGGEDLPLMVGDARLSLSYASASGEFESRWSHVDRLPSAVRLTLSGMNPTPWVHSGIARLRVELPAVCGNKDQVANCLSAVASQPR